MDLTDLIERNAGVRLPRPTLGSFSRGERIANADQAGDASLWEQSCREAKGVTLPGQQA